MLDTESQWSQVLASNSITAIICWLRRLTAEGEAEEILQTFTCWVQRTSEFAKKELLTLCSSRCHGLWMFLDRSSFTRVHLLLQKLRNLLTLAQWARVHRSSLHLWHGVGVPCVDCRDKFDSSDVRHSCWNREQRFVKQHIWLGRLVQWWGIMGLLPKYPEAQEVKRITRMWREMDQSHQREWLETPGCKEDEKGRFGSLIQGMVAQLDRQHGCIWISENSTDQCYPPPNLLALLKLVLVPHIDTLSVQTLLMYFVLDVSNFLQCKDDLLQSFCNAFIIPSSFSQQIRAFWMLDHGHIKASMELLLSPKAAGPRFSWQHRCIIHCLLTRKHPQLALRYLHWTRPPIQSMEDAKLYASVLLQNSCVCEAWALLKRGHTERDNMVVYFLQACNRLGLSAEALKYIPAGYNGEGDEMESTESQLLLNRISERPPCPLSATLYQAQSVHPVSTEDLIQLVIKAGMDVRKPHPKISEVLWPEHTERKPDNEEISVLHHLTPNPLQTEEEIEQTEEPEEELIFNQQPESPQHFWSSLDMGSESLSSITSASALPPLSWDPLYVFESTLTMQRISSLLADGVKQIEGEEDDERDSRTPSSAEALPDCPVVILTAEGATDPVFLSSWDKEAILFSVEDVTNQLGSAVSIHQEDPSDCISDRTVCETVTSDCFLEDQLHQDLLTDLHSSRLPENPEASHSQVSAGPCLQDISLQTFGSSLTPGLTGDIPTGSGPSDSTNWSSSSVLPDYQKMGNLWNQGQEKSGTAIKADHQKSSFLLSQPFSQSMPNFVDFTAKQRGEKEAKQADKEEPAGWSSSGRDSKGAIRSVRTRPRKGKRVKRA